MDIIDKNIDGGKGINWGRTSKDYAKYRDIYPEIFYKKIIDRNLCIKGQKILDLGTGTGVLPRNMYYYGAKWTGVDISKEQIEQAKILSKDMDIDYDTMATEEICFPDNSFDIITTCQCFWYFKHEEVMDTLYHILKPNGRILILYMAWLPYEDEIAGASEKLILKYSKNWSGAGEIIHPIIIPDCYFNTFEMIYQEEYPIKVHFNRENWNGRMKACRGIGASLSTEEIEKWEQEHIQMLNEIAPNEFDILHYVAMAELKKK